MFANCKLPYWRLKNKQHYDVFFELIMSEGPEDIEDIMVSNENLKRKLIAKRTGKKNTEYLFRYRPRILKP